MIHVYCAIRKNDKIFLSLHTAVCNIIYIQLYAHKNTEPGIDRVLYFRLTGAYFSVFFSAQITPTVISTAPMMLMSDTGSPSRSQPTISVTNGEA